MSFAADDDKQRWLRGEITPYEYEILKRGKELERTRARRLLGVACGTET